MRTDGVDEATIEEVLGNEDAGEFEIFADNVESYLLFAACASKWTYGPLGGVTGLDDVRISNVMRWQRVKDKAAMFDDLRVMEHAARTELNKKTEQDQ